MAHEATEHNLRVVAIQESWSDVVGKIQASLPLIRSRRSSHDAATAKSQSWIPQNLNLALGIVGGAEQEHSLSKAKLSTNEPGYHTNGRLL